MSDIGSVISGADVWTVVRGVCPGALRDIPDESIDAIVSDPIYPEIDRHYGHISEADWHVLMRGVVAESRRVLKSRGSAVFILQPNSERVGRMRPWLWEFIAWTSREWGMVQDAYWWNYAALPVGGAPTAGLMRGSVKPCVWLGPEDCWRDQEAVLWSESERNKIESRADRGLKRHPSGRTIRRGVISAAADKRGGVTPFNLIPVANTASNRGAGEVTARWRARRVAPRAPRLWRPDKCHSCSIAWFQDWRRIMVIDIDLYANRVIDAEPGNRLVPIFCPDGTEDVGRVIASHVTVADGLRGIGVPRAGAPPAIVEVGGVPVPFGRDGWELAAWDRAKPRHEARCLCPDAGASEVAS